MGLHRHYPLTLTKPRTSPICFGQRDMFMLTARSVRTAALAERDLPEAEKTGKLVAGGKFEILEIPHGWKAKWEPGMTARRIPRSNPSGSRSSGPGNRWARAPNHSRTRQTAISTARARRWSRARADRRVCRVDWTSSDGDPVLVADTGLPAVVLAGPHRRAMTAIGIDDRAAATAIGRVTFADSGAWSCSASRSTAAAFANCSPATRSAR
jgi:hypothetical protein